MVIWLYGYKYEGFSPALQINIIILKPTKNQVFQFQNFCFKRPALPFKFRK